MASSTKVISFVALVCIVYTSILSPTKARTMPSGVHSQEPLEDGSFSRSNFEDFVRAFVASQTNSDLIIMPSHDEMPNDVFPLDSANEHHQHVMTEEPEGKHARLLKLQKQNAVRPVFQKRSGGRYCGSLLADVLELVCGKSFLTVFANKRSVPTEKEEYKNSAAPAGESESWPFVSGDKALQVLSNQHSFHRFTRGVHDECCLKPCSYHELTLYCSHPKIDPALL